MEFDWIKVRRHHGELAAAMVHLVDQSEVGLAILEILHEALRTDEEIDEAERFVASEFMRAKRERPDLSVNVAPATADYPNAALLVAVHEHQWVGGQCIRGCGQERAT